MVDKSLLLNLMEEPFSADRVKCLIAGLREELKDLNAVWHPLGFICIKLHGTEDSTLRMHIWHPTVRSTQQPAWQIHDHIFSLESYVICGDITNYIYSIALSKSPNCRLYQVHYEAQRSCLFPTDSLVVSDVQAIQHYSKGECYFIPQGILHASDVPIGTLTATLVRTSNHKNVAPTVLGDVDGSGLLKYTRSACDASLLSEVFLKIWQSVSD